MAHTLTPENFAAIRDGLKDEPDDRLLLYVSGSKKLTAKHILLLRKFFSKVYPSRNISEENIIAAVKFLGHHSQLELDKRKSTKQ